MTKRFLLSVLVVLLLIFGAYSCSKKIYPGTGSVTILYPPPPDTARIQFLTRFGSSDDFAPNQSRLKTFVAGMDDPKPIRKPYGIALNKGRLFIVDPDIAGLQHIDLDKNTLNYFLPSGRGQLRIPINCNFDKDGNMYVTDVQRQQVVIYNENLEYYGEIGGGENFKPTDVFIVGDTIFITDPNNHRINAYNRSTQTFLFSFPEKAKVGDENWLYNPLNLWVTSEQIYVTDFGNSQVKVFDLKGNFLRSIGSYGRALGQFVRPKGIAVDEEINLYVVDAGFENVQIFNRAGQLLMFIGGSYRGPGDMYLPANVTIDYDHIKYFEHFVDPNFNLQYLIFVTNQYGPDKVNVYGRVIPK